VSRAWAAVLAFQHLSRAAPAEHKVVRVRFRDGKPVGDYEDFLTGFVLDEGNLNGWGRPVSVLVARDGALLVSDDGGHRVWRVSYSAP
jgi:glucose/arabinose dehydrogenase